MGGKRWDEMTISEALAGLGLDAVGTMRGSETIELTKATCGTSYASYARLALEFARPRTPF